MIRLLWLLLGALVISGYAGTVAQSRPRPVYDLWAKERIRFLRNQVDRRPRDARVRVLLAAALFADGVLQDAKRELLQAVELEPELAEAQCNLGVILYRQGRWEEARARFTTALRLDSTMVEAMVGLGTLWCRMGDHESGLECMARAVRLAPQQKAVRYNLAVGYYKAGDLRRAIEQLDVLLKQDPSYPGARHALARACYDRGVTLLKGGAPGAALVQLRRAVSLEEHDESMFFALGLAYIALRDYPAAEAALRQAAAVEPDYVPALQNLGLVCEKLGRTQEAVQYYERVEDLTPQLGTVDAVRAASFDVTSLLP